MPNSLNSFGASLPGAAESIAAGIRARKERKRRESEARAQATAEAEVEAAELQNQSSFLTGVADIEGLRNDPQFSPAKGARIAQRLVTPELLQQGVAGDVNPSKIMDLLSSVSGQQREDVEDMIEEATRTVIENNGEIPEGMNPELAELAEENLRGQKRPQVDLGNLVRNGSKEELEALRTTGRISQEEYLGVLPAFQQGPDFTKYDTPTKVALGVQNQDLTPDQGDELMQILTEAAQIEAGLKPKKPKEPTKMSEGKLRDEAQAGLQFQINTLEKEQKKGLTKAKWQALPEATQELYVKNNGLYWGDDPTRARQIDSLNTLMNDDEALAQMGSAMQEIYAAGFTPQIVGAAKEMSEAGEEITEEMMKDPLFMETYQDWLKSRNAR